MTQTMTHAQTHSQPEDVKWLAQRYALGELDAAAHEAFEARLADDQEAAAAVASAVQLLAVLTTSTPAAGVAAASRNDAARAGWGLAVGILATAAALSAVWLIPGSRHVLNMPDDAADLVAMWADTSPDAPAGTDADGDDEPHGSDEVPDWLLAAVTLEAGGSKVDQVLEN